MMKSRNKLFFSRLLNEKLEPNKSVLGRINTLSKSKTRKRLKKSKKKMK
jgi:hypothetical protein